MIRRLFVCALAVTAAFTFAGCENRIDILKRAQNFRDKDNHDAAIEEYQRLIGTYEDDGDPVSAKVEFEMTNVVLSGPSPVPLPAGGALLLTGLLGLGAASRRRKRK